MNMNTSPLPSILCVGIDLDQAPVGNRDVSIAAADSAGEALELMRVLTFDLVLVGCEVPDATLMLFLQVFRGVWPDQPWALIAPTLSGQEERKARMLGPCGVFARMPELDDLCNLAARVRSKRSRRLPARDVDQIAPMEEMLLGSVA